MLCYICGGVLNLRRSDTLVVSEHDGIVVDGNRMPREEVFCTSCGRFMRKAKVVREGGLVRIVVDV